MTDLEEISLLYSEAAAETDRYKRFLMCQRLALKIPGLIREIRELRSRLERAEKAEIKLYTDLMELKGAMN